MRFVKSVKCECTLSFFFFKIKWEDKKMIVKEQVMAVKSIGKEVQY